MADLSQIVVQVGRRKPVVHVQTVASSSYGRSRCEADLGFKILTGSRGAGPAVARSDKRSLTCLGS
jgi:hypothetical protein